LKEISVIIPTHNGYSRGFLNEAIQSVLNQTFQDFELIIVDDGSTDLTSQLCKKFLSNNVFYIFQNNKGLAVARNTGILNSKGSYICFLDDDDIWEYCKLEKQYNFFKNISDSQVGMVFTSIILIDEKGKEINSISHYADGNIFNDLLFNNIIDAPSSVMIKKEVFSKVGLFREEMKYVEDYELWLRIAKNFNIYSLNEFLVKYRIHSNQMTRNNKKMEFYNLMALFLNLENEDDKIADLSYKFLFSEYAIKHFWLNNYDQFRKYYKIASVFGKLDFQLRIRFFLSYFKPIYRLLKIIQKKIFKNENSFCSYRRKYPYS